MCNNEDWCEGLSLQFTLCIPRQAVKMLSSEKISLTERSERASSSVIGRQRRCIYKTNNTSLIRLRNPGKYDRIAQVADISKLELEPLCWAIPEMALTLALRFSWVNVTIRQRSQVWNNRQQAACWQHQPCLVWGLSPSECFKYRRCAPPSIIVLDISSSPKQEHKQDLHSAWSVVKLC